MAKTAVYIKLGVSFLILSFLLAGCSGLFGGAKEVKLPGKRIEVLSSKASLKADARIRNLSISLPRPVVNSDWMQAGGQPNHSMHHLGASGPLSVLWKTDIGKGSDKEGQLLAQPVVAKGLVFTLDINAEVSAFNLKTGRRVWQNNLSKDSSHEGTLGGGLGFDKGTLFVTTGFGEVIAIEAKSGVVIWRSQLDTVIRAPPTVWAGRVFTVTIANELYALNARNGQTLWTHSGLQQSAGLVGAAAVAAEGNIVVVPYSSGEVVALRVENGRQIWTETLSPLRRSGAVTAIAHIRGRPVIDRGVVYIVGNSGRTVAVDLRTGTRLWEVPIGGANGAWVAGEFVFVVTREAELVCLTRRTGLIRWVRQLKKFEDEEDKEGRILWSGPLLAGDKLLLGNSEEELLSVWPYSGKLLRRIKLRGPILISPLVASETVLVLTDEGDLVALR